MKVNKILVKSRSALIILQIFIVAIFIGCISKQPSKTWQRLAAEKAYAELASEKDDLRRGAIRDYIKALLSLEKGGSQDNQFSHGRTLLMMAIVRKDLDIVNRLVSLDVYADVNCADEAGNTPLIVACEQNDVEIVKILIKAGAQINRQNNKGMSALMACAKNGNKTSAEDLMMAGANRHQKDAEGYLVGDYASQGNHLEMISFISDFQSK